MVLGITTVALMFATVLIRWCTALGLRDRKRRLSEAVEEKGHARHRLKVAIGESSIAEREIEKCGRKIRTTEHRLIQLARELEGLSHEAREQQELTREKLRLAEEVKKRKGLG
jgi:hypothetical protein